MRHLTQAIRPDIESQKKPLSSWSRSSTSSTSTDASDITFTRERGCSIALTCCAICTVIMIGVGATAGVYFGFLTEQLRDMRQNELRMFRGQLRLTSGDSYSSSLSNSSTDEYVRKAGFYKNKLDSIFKHSVFRSAFIRTEILALDGTPKQDLIIHFNVRMDARRIPVDAGDLYIVLAESLQDGSVLSQYEIDHDSLQIQERTSVMRSFPPEPDALEELQAPPSPAAVASATPAPRQCEPLNVPFCSQMSYNSTSYPNLLGMVDAREVENFIIGFREVVDSECYRLAQDFVCQLLQPACSRDLLLPPCRSYCHEFYSACNARLPSRFHDKLLCDNFPALGEESCLPKPGCVRDMELLGYSGRVCDGVADCPDLSDESGCASCPDGHVRCPSETTCVPDTAVCDGVADCSRAGDELGCVGVEASRNALETEQQDSVEGFLTYAGWGRSHVVCSETDPPVQQQNYSTLSAEVDVSDACQRLSYSVTETREARAYVQSTSSEFVKQQPAENGSITFRSTSCPSQQAVYIKCSHHACGAAPLQTALSRDRPGETGEADLPWNCRLHHGGRHLCDAVLIHPQWLVTSAECFTGLPKTHWQATMGSHRLSSWPAHSQTRKVTGMVRAPDGGSTVALVKLDSPFQVTGHVRPICADPSATRWTNPELADCYAIHWNTEDGVANYVPLRVEHNCTAEIPFTKHTICASSMTDQGYQGTEMVGAPLVCRTQGAWHLVGVSTSDVIHNTEDVRLLRRIYDEFSRNVDWIRSSMASFDGA